MTGPDDFRDWPWRDRLLRSIISSSERGLERAGNERESGAQAMASFQAAVEIARAPVEVFSFLMDPSNNLLWQANLVAAGALDEEPVGLGSRFWEIRSILGRHVESSFQLVEFDPPVVATTRCTAGPVPFVATYHLHHLSGGCRLGTSGAVPDDLLPRMAGRLIVQAAQRDIRRDLAALKAVLEDPTTSRAPAPAGSVPARHDG